MGRLIAGVFHCKECQRETFHKADDSGRLNCQECGGKRE